MSPDGIEPTLPAWKAEVLTIRRRASKVLGGIGRRIGFKIQFSFESTGSSPVAPIVKDKVDRITVNTLVCKTENDSSTLSLP